MDEPETRQNRILLVEDEALIALSRKQLLSKQGYEVTTSFSGEEAVATATHDTAINLVLMDIDLGSGIDGTEAAQQIQEVCSVPIVFLTSHSEQEYVDRAKKISNYGYVLKNSGEFVLIEHIEMAISLFQANQNLKQENEKRKNLQEELRLSEEFLKRITSNSPVAIFVYDVNEERVVFGNEAYEHHLGYTVEEIQEMGPELLERIYHPDYKEHLRQHDEKLLADREGEVFETEYQIVQRDGGSRWAWVRELVLTRNPDGTAARILGIALDVTERKRREEMLKRSEEKYRLLFNYSNDAIFVHEMGADDLPGKNIEVNEQATRLLGYSREELLNISAKDVAPERHASAMYVHAQELMEKKHLTFETENTRKDGVVVPVEVSAYLHTEGNKRFVVSSVRDTNKRKQAEKGLAHKSKLLEESQVLANLGSWEWDIVYDTWYFSEQWKNIHGVSDNGLTTSRLFEIAHPEDAPHIEQALSEAKDQGETYDIEHRIIRVDNRQIRYIKAVGEVEFDEGTGHPVRMAGAAQDITERKEHDKAIQKALEEKDLLMREVNHRVKNNLSLVSSLISLKESACGGEVDLSDIRNRVKAIEKVHQSLQHSDDTTRIRLRSYVADILSSVFQSWTGHHVAIHSDIPDISVPTKAAIPLGLIINETATNALQHGFTGQEESRFSVAFEEDQDTNQYVLTISNTGQPLPEDLNIENPRGLGLQLVSALVAQLQGTLDLQRRPQPLFTIRFPMSPPEG